jgi:hypothetical protein
LSDTVNVSAQGKNTGVTYSDVVKSGTNRTVYVSGLSRNDNYTFDLESCDFAGTCDNNTVNVLMGEPICSGWTALGAMNTSSNSGLEYVSNQSGASTVSYYNNTDQTFYTFTIGSTANAGIVPEEGSAVFLYSEYDAGVWVRNLVSYTNSVVLYDESAVSVDTNRTIANITASICSNSDYGYLAGCENLTGISWFNVSSQKYQPHINNWSYANTTLVERGLMMWVFISDEAGNITWVRD